MCAARWVLVNHGKTVGFPPLFADLLGSFINCSTASRGEQFWLPSFTRNNLNSKSTSLKNKSTLHHPSSFIFFVSRISFCKDEKQSKHNVTKRRSCSIGNPRWTDLNIERNALGKCFSVRVVFGSAQTRSGEKICEKIKKHVDVITRKASKQRAK